MNNRTKLFGVGVNDLPYPVTKYDIVDCKMIQTWICPFYACWKYMLDRCYNPRESNKSYRDVWVCQSWHKASNFKEWMEIQRWEGNVLDKDILVVGNKLYSPETCAFVPDYVNTFFATKKRTTQEYPLGVSKQDNQYIARSSKIYLGRFYNTHEAHSAWKEYKLKSMIELVSRYSSENFANKEVLVSINARLEALIKSIENNEEVFFL